MTHYSSTLSIEPIFDPTPAKLIRFDSILTLPPPGRCLTLFSEPILDLIGFRPNSVDDVTDSDVSSDSTIDWDDRTDSDFRLKK